MPVKSKAQLRKLYALEAEGKLPKGTAKKWLKKYGKPTVERVEKKAEAPAPVDIGKRFSDARRARSTGEAKTALKKMGPFEGKKPWEVEPA